MTKSNTMKTYRVVTHEANYTPPDFGSLLPVGEFDTAEEAIKCLKQVIDKQLLASLNEGKTPKEIYDQFSLYGEIPIIQGEPRVYVQPYEYAKERIDELIIVKIFERLEERLSKEEREVFKLEKKGD
jgi:hypothetical protein